MTLTTEAALRKDKTNATSDMQHRHFATIAAIIANQPGPTTSIRRQMATHFANGLAHNNPKFDRARFLRACGVAS
jgi:hypothetical protein